jgi:hypothetical protein
MPEPYVSKRELLITVILVFILLFSLWFDAYAQNDQHVQSVTVKYQETYDTNGIQFYELRKGAEAILLSAPEQSELAKFLARHNGSRLILSLEKP